MPKSSSWVLAALLLLASPAQANGQRAVPRTRTLIDSGWSFQLDPTGDADHSGPVEDDSLWRPVQLPHDFVVEGKITPGGDSSHGFRPKGVGWYRKDLDIPANPDGRTWLEFDGVYRDSKVWLNGVLLGEHQSGYTSFYYDVTPYVIPGKPNQLVVRADARNSEGWWYEGGGIYRHVWLTTVAPIHVAHWGTFVTTPTISASHADVHIATEIENETGAPTTVELESILLDGNRQRAAQSTIWQAPTGVSTANQVVELSSPKLWSPDTPHMYTLRTLIKQGSVVVDRYDTPFGVRSIQMDPDKGLLLNGQPIKIKGVATHDEFAAVGSAVTDNLNQYRIEILKSMGCNGYRCAHNPPTPELLDDCDRLGIMVMDENRHVGDTWRQKASPRTPYNDLSEIDAMVRRDRNHPSVIFWSLCNEEWGLQTSQAGLNILTAMNSHLKALDSSRPTTLAEGGGAWDAGSPNLRDAVDVAGANYAMDKYDDYHARFPNKPLVATEFASFISTRGIYADDTAHGYQTSYPDVRPGEFGWMTPPDAAWAAIALRPFVAGGFVWAGFEYRGEPTPYQWPYVWPDANGGWGQMDLCTFPKDAFYYFKAVWGPQDRPVVHVFPHWNWAGQEGQPVRVCVYTNADEVQLSLNGTPIGPPKSVTPYLHVEWTVPYAPGVLTAQGFKEGKPFGSDQVVTTGAPFGMAIQTRTKAFKANLEDILPVEVDIIDAKGRIVPDANPHLTFSVTGAATIVGAGNGNPSDHDIEAAPNVNNRQFERSAFNGKALVLLRSTGVQGTVVLTITADGDHLKPAFLKLRTR